MIRAGMINIGQLVREQTGSKQAILVGFGTHRGSVIAAREWGEPTERMLVPPATEGSWDDLIWRLGAKSTLLIFPDTSIPAVTMGQRAIGVVYNPACEKYGNYVDTLLPSRYDTFIHIGETHALHPLHMPVSLDEELPETFHLPLELSFYLQSCWHAVCVLEMTCAGSYEESVQHRINQLQKCIFLLKKFIQATCALLLQSSCKTSRQ